MTIELFAASYAHRYCDPCATAVGLTAEATQIAIEEAMQHEREELPAYCEIDHTSDTPEEDCTFCNPDLVTYGVWPVYHTADFGGLRKTINIIKDAKENPNGVTFPEMY